jgi:hypothetical protein
MNGDGVAEGAAGAGPAILVYGMRQTATGPQAIPPTDGELLVQNMAPLDSFDFTGLVNPLPASATPGTFTAHIWHYARPAPQANVPADHQWQFVYPGRYDANQSNTPLRAGEPNTVPRQQGTQVAGTAPAAAGFGWQPQGATPSSDPWDPNSGPGNYVPPMPPVTLSGGNFVVNLATVANGLAQAATPVDREGSYPTSVFPMQIFSSGSPGPIPVATVGANQNTVYPFGGFARDGDLLWIPYVGGYRIQLLPNDTAGNNTVLELNALSMDASFAEDTDTTDDPINTGIIAGNPQTYRAEQIGRCCPTALDFQVLGRGVLLQSSGVNSIVDNDRTEGTNLIGTEIAITGGTGQGQVRTIVAVNAGPPVELVVARPWSVIPDQTSRYEIRAGHYRWATKLFDYLAASGPQADFLPDTVSALTGPDAISNDGGAIRNQGRENTAPTHGLININTAPLTVMKTIPWAQMVASTANPAPTDQWTISLATHTVTAPGGDGLDNDQIAQAIVNWRDRELASGVVPFASIMDLYRVPEFMALSDAILQSNTDPGDEEGDISPADTLPGGGSTPNPVFLDGVRRDFEEQFLPLTRVSNLITTRSDSYTNYILVQGWRGLGTQSPELVVQRRRAFTVDRSPVSQSNRDVPIQYFFND